MEREEGEMSDDSINISSPKNFDSQMDTSDASITVVYKPDNLGLIIGKLCKTDAKKLEERAKRFGLDFTGKRAITQKQIDELYDNFDVKSGNERHFRFDTLHLSGVEDLSTKDIFEYLEDYKPVSLEWIDRTSCNIVCQDHITAALAILAHSREIKGELKKMVMGSTSYHWREGFPHPKKDLILFRFATNSDKMDLAIKAENRGSKLSHSSNKGQADSNEKNPWGDLCKSWGIYDQQEVYRPLPRMENEANLHGKLAVTKNQALANRLGKRQYNTKSDDSEESSSDSEWKSRSKAPRMRMHADDEDPQQTKSKLPLQVIKDNLSTADEFAPLSIEIINEANSSHISKPATKLSDKFKAHSKIHTNNRKTGIHSRLGVKLCQSDDSNSGDDVSIDYPNRNKISSIIEKKSNNIWSRLEHNKQADLKITQDDLRQKIKSRKQTGGNGRDLRTKIDTRGKGRSPLRIEIDNEYYSE